MKGWWGLWVGLVSGLVAAAMFLRRRQEEVPGEAAGWVRAGTLAELSLYPLKSGHYVSLSEAHCTARGLAVLPVPGVFTLSDRCLVVYRGEEGAMVTARTFPTLLQVRVGAAGDCLSLSHPSQPDLLLRPPSDHRPSRVKMWNDEMVDTVDCGDAGALWVSAVIAGRGAPPKYRLGCWQPHLPARNLLHHRAFSNEYADVSNNDSGCYSDLASYMLMTKSSLEDLSSRLNGKSITPKQFRPNFFIDNTGKPFEEDGWKWVKIGKDAIFKNVKPCTRCILTTIDPETSKRDTAGEPLKTLKKYRLIENSHSPVMGINLGLYGIGSVKVGDAVYVIPK